MISNVFIGIALATSGITAFLFLTREAGRVRDLLQSCKRTVGYDALVRRARYKGSRKAKRANRRLTAARWFVRRASRARSHPDWRWQHERETQTQPLGEVTYSRYLDRIDWVKPYARVRVLDDTRILELVKCSIAFGLSVGICEPKGERVPG